MTRFEAKRDRCPTMAPWMERPGGAGPSRQRVRASRQTRGGLRQTRQRALRQRPGAVPALHSLRGNGKREDGVSRADQRIGRAELCLDAQIVDQPCLADLSRD